MSVIIPTFNEADNIITLLERLEAVLSAVDYEVIVVDDDSPDQTWQLVQRYGLVDPRVRLVRRIGRRGLSSAVLEGMDAGRGSVLAVIDADLQHDERALPEICSLVLDGHADVCLGSRQAPGGSYGEFGPLRRLMSFAGAQMARPFLGVAVSDPMSGYFAVSRERLDTIRPEINPRGFKILLDVLARGPRPRVAEIGYGFRARRAGETKLTGSVMASYLLAIGELAASRIGSKLITQAQNRLESLKSPGAPRFIVYVGVAVTALSLRMSLMSLIRTANMVEAVGLVAAEFLIVGEYLVHDRITFGQTPDTGMRRIGQLGRFHVIALAAALAQLGIGDAFERQLRGLPVGQNIVPLFVAGTGCLMATILAAYRLNRTITWPEVSSDDR